MVTDDDTFPRSGDPATGPLGQAPTDPPPPSPAPAPGDPPGTVPPAPPDPDPTPPWTTEPTAILDSLPRAGAA